MKSSVPSSVKRPNFGFIETAMFTRIHSKWLPTRSKVPSIRKSFWQILSTKYLSFLVVISSSLYVTPAESRTVADCQSQVSSTLDIFYFYFTCPSSSNIPPRYVNDPPPLCRPWRWLQFLLSLANKNEKFFFIESKKKGGRKIPEIDSQQSPSFESAIFEIEDGQILEKIINMVEWFRRAVGSFSLPV